MALTEFNIVMFSEDVIKRGWIFKQSRYLKKWRKRYAVITKSHLLTYKSENINDSPTEKIPFKWCNGVKSAQDETNKASSFRLDYNGELYFFYTEE